MPNNVPDEGILVGRQTFLTVTGIQVGQNGTGEVLLACTGTNSDGRRQQIDLLLDEDTKHRLQRDLASTGQPDPTIPVPAANRIYTAVGSHLLIDRAETNPARIRAIVDASNRRHPEQPSVEIHCSDDDGRTWRVWLTIGNPYHSAWRALQDKADG